MSFYIFVFAQSCLYEYEYEYALIVYNLISISQKIETNMDMVK